MIAAQTIVEIQGLSIGGLIVMIGCIGLVCTLCIFCYYRLFRGPDRPGSHTTPANNDTVDHDAQRESTG